MKTFTIAVLFAVSLLLSAGASFAAEVKQPDVKGAVKAVGEGVKADAKASAAAKENVKVKASEAKSAAKVKLVDLNSATDAELKAVPGIGDAYAAKIIAGRPYANKAQLKSRKIIPGTVYEQVKDQLVARQPQKK